MKRREFCAGIGGAAMASALLADEQSKSQTRPNAPPRGLRVLPIGYEVWGLAFSPKEPVLATCGCIRGDITPSRLRELERKNRVPKGPTALVLWDVTTLKPQKTLDGGSECVSVAFSSDGKKIAAGRFGRGVRIWDVVRGEEIVTLAEHQISGDVQHSSVGFMENDQWLISSSTGAIRVWDIQSESLTHRLDYRQATTTVAIPPRGDYLVSGGHGGELAVWLASRGELNQLIKIDAEFVHEAVFSPDGGLLGVLITRVLCDSLKPGRSSKSGTRRK